VTRLPRFPNQDLLHNGIGQRAFGSVPNLNAGNPIYKYPRGKTVAPSRWAIVCSHPFLEIVAPPRCSWFLAVAERQPHWNARNDVYEVLPEYIEAKEARPALESGIVIFSGPGAVCCVFSWRNSGVLSPVDCVRSRPRTLPMWVYSTTSGPHRVCPRCKCEAIFASGIAKSRRPLAKTYKRSRWNLLGATRLASSSCRPARESRESARFRRQLATRAEIESNLPTFIWLPFVASGPWSVSGRHRCFSSNAACLPPSNSALVSVSLTVYAGPDWMPGSSAHIRESGEYLESREGNRNQDIARLVEQSSVAEVSPYLADSDFDLVLCPGVQVGANEKPVCWPILPTWR